uniref:DENN domain-containing protein 11-like n=1 Tax=Doryrhamphus excisus TaxID=161450 RepID=UPI0025AE6D48|nr:DENN domain-containing protein 11-like [Doryrhamphus excisus]XP_057942837.1 DENN domain-containing protein 11-like [Doryrhamphus excisus]XP_057942838.1 DENN domain-containing protein 11-like [Doryrhamphus excisus]XP_057942839.1 DENN domain-containing protein 11-like [Doryrhamphus excisus]XP_057942840.1 DENN domain-containing protein 11-like [Doryrhamphus excisus]XP_057942841.1 DENN domain-containing protein 11-like [Doryrhamphus excisus]XP_057942842.1 DENN domain-containing protein 11-like
MVEQSDKAPLLDWEEIPPSDANRAAPSPPAPPREKQDVPAGKKSSIAVGLAVTDIGRRDVSTTATCSPTPVVGGRERSTAGRAHTRGQPGAPFPDVTGRDQWEEKDQIVAVFVVTFNTRSGNMVEWSLPHDINLDGVEFKAMASGSHRITNDFIYFRKGCYFGLACFANMPVDNELERGARMKSVGILSPSYTLLYRYMHFLENQVRLQLKNPGQYSPLEAFYEDKKAILPPTGNGLVNACPTLSVTTINRCMHPEMKITHPAGCMSQFVQFFGEHIMVLWKFALLRKRLLIFSPPPVGVVCYRVYCCCSLANVSLPAMGMSVPEFRPFFYINIADIGALQTEQSYVACTTEKIFEEKKELYDLYIDNQNVKTHRSHLLPLLRLNAADKERYRKLSEQRQLLQYSQEVDGDSTANEEDLFIVFFMELNNRIFHILSEVAGGADPVLTAEHVRAMGLDPQGDRCFLAELLEVYAVDVTLVIDNLCCH